MAALPDRPARHARSAASGTASTARRTSGRSTSSAASARLGTQLVGAELEGSLVLLVRGELLRRYPNAVVYAVPAAADGRLDAGRRRSRCRCSAGVSSPT